MRYRKEDADGDFVFGQGAADYYTGIDAVRLAIQTRLQLLQGGFWRDVSDGLPLMQRILVSPGSEANLNTVTGIIQQRIASTPGVTSVQDISASFDSVNRAYAFRAVVQTQYSDTVITGTL